MAGCFCIMENGIFMISETLQPASLDTMNAPDWPNVISHV